MRLLVAVPACSRYDYGSHEMGIRRVVEPRIEGIRQTWWQDFRTLQTSHEVVPMLFYGRGLQRDLLPDEALVNVLDDYTNLPEKMRAIWNWGVEQGFDFIYKCDDDTFVYVDRLVNSGFEQHDYFGYGDKRDYDGQYISGGSGYFLSARAARLVVSSGVSPHWAEDYWTGQVMLQNGVSMTKDPRFLISHLNQHYITVPMLPRVHDYISMHACTVAQMDQLYAMRHPEQAGVALDEQNKRSQEIVIRGRVVWP